jgi:hypothetical protein
MVYESVISKKDLLKYGVEYNIGIFYKDLSWAKSIYKILYKKLNASIYTSRNNTHDMDIVLYGGIRYKFVCATADEARGYRFNRVYIQDGMAQDIVDNIIMPSIMNMDRVITIE